ncbi:MAG TPA: nuclear transport factor 2 family protein, partial [Thermoanaerobaculia bacterium]|nr:nuclear transport factor 2 family protein [Thermoanaerobaculia bacterium]
MHKNAMALLLLLLAGCAASTVPADAPLPERERLLTRALVRHEPGVLDAFLTDDFRCEVQGMNDAAMPPSTQRRTLCTGLGHQRPGSENGADVKRSAVVHSMDVQEIGSTATVRMEQSYFGWFPHDGGFERRSRVTDTWVQQRGVWRLAKRVTEP